MILVTGTSGFIGSFLLDALIQKYGKDQIVALTSHPIDKCQFLLHNNYTFNSDLFSNKGFSKIETIIHAGAFTPKNSSESNSIEKCNSNISNTYRLISANLPNLKRLIFLSTLDVYGNDSTINEKSAVNPVSLYGNSKWYCEKMIEAWGNEKNISYQILRIGHVYGPGEEKYQKLIPIVIKQVLENKPVKLFGEGKDIRTFIYISDVIQSIIASIGLEQKNETINVVGDEQVTVKKLIETIFDLCGKHITLEKITTGAPIRNLIFDNTKLRELLHTPEIELKEGLTKEIQYFKKL